MVRVKSYNIYWLKEGPSGGFEQGGRSVGYWDEFWLKIYPITLGTGKRLFREGIIPLGYKLIENPSSPGGVIVATYKRYGTIKFGTFE